MNLKLTEEQELIRSSVREVLEAECPMAHVRAMHTDPIGYSKPLWSKMAELGWMGLAFPEEHGGLGNGLVDLCLLIEEMGRVCLPSPFVPTIVLGGLPILHFGSDAQKSVYLPAIVEGRLVLTCAVLETGAGWSAESPSTVAVADGDAFVLSGSKILVPYASAADAILVVARTEGATRDGLTVFVIDGQADGVARTPVETVASEHVDTVTFTRVRVGTGRVLGTVGGGLPIVEAIERWGSAARSAEMVGGASRVLDMTVDYAKERHQFGQPIGSFQAVQHHAANMAIDLLAARFIAYEAIWRLEMGIEAESIVSMAKAWTGEAYTRICRLGHQVHGAIGYTHEHDLQVYLRHAITSDLTFGDAHHHREQVARQLGL